MTKVPNFLFIGPDKTGSSWIHHVLNEHPDSFVPQKIKETFFFDRFYQRGLNWYFSFFKECPSDAQAVGEICHDYLFSKLAADRIKHDLPKVKVLTCLRNPIERSFSQYLYLLRSGITRKPFATAIKDIPRLTENSLYYKHLSYYFDLFESEKIKVLFFDELRSDPSLFAKDLFSFLGLKFLKDIDYHQQILPANRPRSFFIARIAKAGADIARRFSLEGLVGNIKSSRLMNLLYLPYKNSNKPELNEDIQKKLIQYFYNDIIKLEQLLEKDLSHWLVIE